MSSVTIESHCEFTNPVKKIPGLTVLSSVTVKNYHRQIHWKTSTALLSAAAQCFLFLFCFPLPVVAGVGEIWRNNRAVDQMNQKKVLEAYESFHQLLGQNPFHPLFQFNLGASLITVEEPEKAIKMYKELLKSRALPLPMEFAVLYNLGALYGLKEDVDQALDFYQQALDKNPDSKEVKINIELLIQKAGFGWEKDGQEFPKKKVPAQKMKPREHL